MACGDPHMRLYYEYLAPAHIEWNVSMTDRLNERLVAPTGKQMTSLLLRVEAAEAAIDGLILWTTKYHSLLGHTGMPRPEIEFNHPPKGE